MEIWFKIMEKSRKSIGQHVYEPCFSALFTFLRLVDNHIDMIKFYGIILNERRKCTRVGSNILL